MKQYIKKVIAMMLCIAMCFSFFAVTSNATVSDAYHYAVDTFPAFLRKYFSKNPNTALPSYLTGIGNALLNGTASDDDVKTAYDQYVNDINENVGTAQITKNGIRVYVNPMVSKAYVNGFQSHYDNGVLYVYGTIASSGYVSLNYGGNKNIPFNAYVTTGMKYEADNAQYQTVPFIVNGVTSAIGETISVAQGGRYQLQYTPCFKSIKSTDLSSINISFWYDLTPYAGVLQDYYTNVNISIDNRMTVVMPSIYNYNSTNNTTKYYIGTVENNTVTNVYETNIFNETTNVFTEPATNVTYNISNWTYDYNTRSYVCVDVDGNTYIVQYGDDAVYVTVPDGSGGTSRKTYHYITQTPPPSDVKTDPNTGLPVPSTDDYEDDPNTTGGFFSTIWKAIKEGLADLIAGIIKKLFAGIKKFIVGLLDLFNGLLSSFVDSVGSFFDAFKTSGVFGFFDGSVSFNTAVILWY